MKKEILITAVVTTIILGIFLSGKTYTVKNTTEFLAALDSAKYGDEILVNGIINLSAHPNTVIPMGIILNGKNGYIFSSTFCPGDQYKAMLVTGGPDVTIKNLTLIGPSGDIMDHDTSTGYACAIKSNYSGLTVDNCLFKNWDKWAIYLYFQDRCTIKNSEFEFIRRAGYGYAIWTGGAGSDSVSACTIEDNRFDYCRACIDGSGHRNSYYFKNNWIGRNQLYYNVKRHPSGNKNYYGGITTFVDNNIFLSTQQHFELPYPMDKGMTVVTNNYFTRKDLDSIAPAGMIGGRFYWALDTPNVIVSGNHFNGEGIKLPVAKINSVDSIRAGSTIKFECPDSYSGYIWRFGTGKADGNEQRVRKYNQVYSTPGTYTASLAVINGSNKQSENTQKEIRVYPSSGTYLTFNIKDSYNGRTWYCYKQVLIDSTVVWQDDIAGNEGWQKVVIPYDTTKKHTVHFRLICKSEEKNPIKTEVYMWLDDVAICSPTSFKSWRFEDGYKLPSMWYQAFSSPSICPGQGISTAVTTEDCRSGEQSLRIRIPYNSKPCAGMYAEFNLIN